MEAPCSVRGLAQPSALPQCRASSLRSRVARCAHATWLAPGCGDSRASALPRAQGLLPHAQGLLRSRQIIARSLAAGSSGGAGGYAVGAFPVPTLMNNVPHAREMRQLFSDDLVASVRAALAARVPRLRTFLEYPEMNAELDTYRIGTLLEGIRDLATALSADGKRVRVCVQGSLGAGAFQAMPLALAGVRRILEMMDWGEDEPGSFIRLGSISAADVADDDDVFILIAPQHITGHSIQPSLVAMCEAAGTRPVIIINGRLTEVPSANNVMSVRGRQERLEFVATFQQVYHFRLIYNKPSIWPIYGVLRYAFGGPWELYKREGMRETEKYVFRRAFESEPGPAEITESILG